MDKEQHTIKDSWVQLALHDYKEGLGKFNEQLPRLVESFNHFTKECFKAGALDQKSKQLLALAISVFANDEYCIIYHTKGALDQGATEAEILESVGVAASLGGGTAMAQGVTLVQDALQELGAHKNVH